MAKKLVTINVEDKELKTTAKSVSAKKTKTVENKEVENFGIVEINNASAAKKVKNTVEKGFEKNVCGAVKKTVKAKTAKVDDYFDFSFRVESVEEKPAKSCSKKATTLKMTEAVENKEVEIVSEVVDFDSEANQVIRVARMGSLFGCDKRMINA